MKKLDYKDVTIISTQISSIDSRNKVLLDGIDVFDIKLTVPMIASPMPDVCNGKMAAKLSNLGALGIIHRFQSIEDQVFQFEENLYNNESDRFEIPVAVSKNNIACAIGVTGDYQRRFKALYRAGCRIFCLDTANGANIQVCEAIKWIRSTEKLCFEETKNNIKTFDRVYIIAGNIATAEGYRYLAELNVDAIRVGIAGGSVCETRTETGIYIPMISAIQECAEMRKHLAENILISKHPDKEKIEKLTIKTRSEILYIYKNEIYNEIKKLPLIIADGGIKAPQDMNKAIAAGADLVMCGNAFAGTRETPGPVIDHEGNLYKLYRGAASFSVQIDYTEEEPDYIEGRSTLIPYKRGGVEKVVKRFLNGLRSSMSYANALTLEEYRNNVSLKEL